MTSPEPGVYFIVMPGPGLLASLPRDGGPLCGHAFDTSGSYRQYWRLTHIEPDGNNPERYCVLTEDMGGNSRTLGVNALQHDENVVGFPRSSDPQRWLINIYQRDDDGGAGNELVWSVQREETGNPIYISYKGQTPYQEWGFLRWSNGRIYPDFAAKVYDWEKVLISLTLKAKVGPEVTNTNHKKHS
ncbi:hypothetical protein DEU56DRAFT_758574 [Suillus clintonianus]|uniref:uncharacterized protein n=1 Tax=Suillus clintonianus TaxID=1904413 RepID=UPI001B87A68B|nr:uncharacterized protein DEU56DRAFT_758574 [Suillus clintonianus]KAG2127688.1 hypothetical protein DEU56DRAFT_758574 [Suillus clintonianus]